MREHCDHGHRSSRADFGDHRSKAGKTDEQRRRSPLSVSQIWVIPACGKTDSSSRVGFSVLFALPKTLQSSPFNNGGVQSIFIYPRGRELIDRELIISRGSEEITDAADSVGSEQFKKRWVNDSAGKVVGMKAQGRTKRAGIGAPLLSRVVTSRTTGCSRGNSGMHWSRLLTLHASQNDALSKRTLGKSDNRKLSGSRTSRVRVRGGDQFKRARIEFVHEQNV